MAFGYIVDGAPVEITGDVVLNGAAWSLASLHLIPADERAEVGFSLIVEPDPPPPGQYIASTALALQDGQIVRVATYADIPPPQAAPLPAEVPMHKIFKAALITSWPGHDSLDAAIRATFASFPHPQNVLALAEYDRAANFVTSGATTQATKAALGMSDAQFRDLVLVAVGMA
jgi:hypothetical protein